MTVPPAEVGVDAPAPWLPVLEDDVVSGATRWLKAQSTVVDVPGGIVTGLVITQDRPPERDEFVGGVALVLSYGGPAATGPHTQFRRLRLRVELWADPRRDGADSLVEPAETRRRLFCAFAAVNATLHRVTHDTVWWGSLRTVDCVRLGDLEVHDVPATDGMLRGTCLYAVDVG